MQKVLDSLLPKVLMSGSVGASLPKSQASRSNPRGFSRSGGELQSDTGSRSRMDSTAQHYPACGWAGGAVMAGRQTVRTIAWPSGLRVKAPHPTQYGHDQAQNHQSPQPRPSLAVRLRASGAADGRRETPPAAG